MVCLKFVAALLLQVEMGQISGNKIFICIQQAAQDIHSATLLQCVACNKVALWTASFKLKCNFEVQL